MRSRSSGWWVIVAALAWLSVSCVGDGTSSSPPSSTPERSESPPFALSTVQAGGARGDDLVVVQADTGRVAMRFADGTWSELPPIDETGSWLYRSTGSSVIAGGYRCDALTNEGVCEGGSPSFHRLAEDLSGWDELDVPMPAEPFRDNVEITAELVTGGSAIFYVDAESYLVDADGQVSRFTPRWVLCVIDGALVEPVEDAIIDRPGTFATEQFLTRLRLVSLADLTGPPEVVELPEPVPVLGEVICGAGKVSIVGEGTTEWVFDVAERTLTRIESNSRSAGVQGAQQLDGHAATSPDGTTLFAGGYGRTWSRTGLEPWQDTGRPLIAVWATDSAVLGLDPSSDEVVELSGP